MTKKERKYERKRKEGGFVVFLAVLVVTIAVAIGLSLASVTVKSIQLSSSARQSIYAIYAADTGIECALFWDIRGSEAAYYGSPVFPTSTSSSIPPSGSNLNCLGTDITTVWNSSPPIQQGPSSATTTFELNLPGPRCVIVEVIKNVVSSIRTDTAILSRGYNTTCAFDYATIERAVKVSY